MTSDFLSKILISEYIIAAIRVDIHRLSVVKCRLSEGFRRNEPIWMRTSSLRVVRKSHVGVLRVQHPARMKLGNDLKGFGASGRLGIFDGKLFECCTGKKNNSRGQNTYAPEYSWKIACGAKQNMIILKLRGSERTR